MPAKIISFTSVGTDPALAAVEPGEDLARLLFSMGASMLAVQAQNERLLAPSRVETPIATLSAETLAECELAKARLAEEEAAFWREVDKGKALDRAGCTWSNYEDKSDETPRED